MKKNTYNIKKNAEEAEKIWSTAYRTLVKLINKYNLESGIEIGVAFGGHAEAILKHTKIKKLIGIDPYFHFDSYDDPMNFEQGKFDALYEFTLSRLNKYKKRYQHIRKSSDDAAEDIKDQVDFIYIDARHDYKGVKSDLEKWYNKIKVGGIISGHDYNHPNFPGVKKAVDAFFLRFGWHINSESDGVWWVRKEKLGISFIIPAYNCSTTIADSVESIVQTNFTQYDEIVIVDDASTDDTLKKINTLSKKYPNIKIIKHRFNKGGGATRNTAIENTKNALIFCLDSDNILEKNSILQLKELLISSSADVAAFQELRYFKSSPKEITHTWIFNKSEYGLSDVLSNVQVPIASGNYMFTKESWIRARFYPHSAKALDAWGFGFRQLATTSKLITLPGYHYFHKYGHDSYWVRESKKGRTSLDAARLILEYADLIDTRDLNYILSEAGRMTWFENINKRPIRLKKRINVLDTIKKYFIKYVRL